MSIAESIGLIKSLKPVLEELGFNPCSAIQMEMAFENGLLTNVECKEMKRFAYACHQVQYAKMRNAEVVRGF